MHLFESKHKIDGTCNTLDAATSFEKSPFGKSCAQDKWIGDPDQCRIAAVRLGLEFEDWAKSGNGYFGECVWYGKFIYFDRYIDPDDTTQISDFIKRGGGGVCTIDGIFS